MCICISCGVCIKKWLRQVNIIIILYAVNPTLDISEIYILYSVYSACATLYLNNLTLVTSEIHKEWYHKMNKMITRRPETGKYWWRYEVTGTLTETWWNIYW